MRAFAIAIAVAASGTVSLGCPDSGGSHTGTGGGGAGGGAGAGGAGGNGGSGASCNSDATCGGNIVGTWAITDHCNVGPTSGAPPFCPDAGFSVSAFEETGTYTYRDDGTFSFTLRAMATYTTTYPTACIEGLLTCAELDAAVRESLATDPMYADYTGASCVETSSACACTLSYDVTASRSGTYTASGSTLSQAIDGEDPFASSYCVQGSTLVTSAPAPDGAPPFIYVLKKQ